MGAGRGRRPPKSTTASSTRIGQLTEREHKILLAHAVPTTQHANAQAAAQITSTAGSVQKHMSTRAATHAVMSEFKAHPALPFLHRGLRGFPTAYNPGFKCIFLQE